MKLQQNSTKIDPEPQIYKGKPVKMNQKFYPNFPFPKNY